jgi:hypothetical protein
MDPSLHLGPPLPAATLGRTHHPNIRRKNLLYWGGVIWEADWMIPSGTICDMGWAAQLQRFRCKQAKLC